MKHTFVAVLILVAAPALVHGEKAPSRIAELNTKLLASQSRSTAAYQADPRTAKKPDAKAESTQPVVKLSSRLTFLSDGQRSVAIPRGAILYLSAKSRIKNGDKIVGKLIEWDEFLFQNRGELRFQSVTYTQLMGTTKLTEKDLENAVRSGITTLATHMSRVVSLPPAAFPTPTQP